MKTISLLDAKAQLDHLVDMIAARTEPEIIISVNGKPAVRLIPVTSNASRRIGIAKGAFQVPDDIDSGGAEVARVFHGETGR